MGALSHTNSLYFYLMLSSFRWIWLFVWLLYLLDRHCQAEQKRQRSIVPRERVRMREISVISLAEQTTTKRHGLKTKENKNRAREPYVCVCVCRVVLSMCVYTIIIKTYWSYRIIDVFRSWFGEHKTKLRSLSHRTRDFNNTKVYRRKFRLFFFICQSLRTIQNLNLTKFFSETKVRVLISFC